MEVRNIELLEYVTREGINPFRYWFETLVDPSAQGTIMTRLGRLRLGNLGDFKSLENGVYELRIHMGPGYRIYFGRVLDGKALILLGGSRRSQDKDIKRARIYLGDFLSRIRHEKKKSK